MKRIIISVVFTVLVLPFVWLAGTTQAQQGPNVVAIADATATQCAAATPVAANQTQILAVSPAANGGASTLCFSLNNMGTANPARCGDSVSAVQGQVINPVPAGVATSSGGGTWSACVTSAINCCGVGGSTIIGGAKYTR